MKKRKFLRIAIITFMIFGNAGIVCRLWTMTNLEPLLISVKCEIGDCTNNGSYNFRIDRGFSWISYFDWIFVLASFGSLGYYALKRELAK